MLLNRFYTDKNTPHSEILILETAIKIIEYDSVTGEVPRITVQNFTENCRITSGIPGIIIEITFIVKLAASIVKFNFIDSTKN